MYLQLLRTSYCLAFCCLLGSTLVAQTESSLSQKYPKNSKVLYRTITVQEDIGKIVINIGDNQEFQYEHWQGNAILVEQEIHYENVPNRVFNELMKKNRYSISEKLQTNTLVLQYDSTHRKDLQVNYQDMNEKVYLKLMIPEKMNVEMKRKG